MSHLETLRAVAIAKNEEATLAALRVADAYRSNPVSLGLTPAALAREIATYEQRVIRFRARAAVLRAGGI